LLQMAAPYEYVPHSTKQRKGREATDNKLQRDDADGYVSSLFKCKTCQNTFAISPHLPPQGTHSTATHLLEGLRRGAGESSPKARTREGRLPMPILYSNGSGIACKLLMLMAMAIAVFFAVRHSHSSSWSFHHHYPHGHYPFPHHAARLLTMDHMPHHHSPTMLAQIGSRAMCNGTTSPWSGQTTLDLYGTQFSGTIPNEFNQISCLTSLDLANTFLSGTISKELSKLLNLESLYLYETSISGTIPREFSQLSSLHYL